MSVLGFLFRSWRNEVCARLTRLEDLAILNFKLTRKVMEMNQELQAAIADLEDAVRQSRQAVHTVVDQPQADPETLDKLRRMATAIREDAAALTNSLSQPPPGRNEQPGGPVFNPSANG